MPWHLPDDLKRFKAITLGKPVLMGRKTALAIGRALPGRPNLVLTRADEAPYPGQHVVHSLDEALSAAFPGGSRPALRESLGATFPGGSRPALHSSGSAEELVVVGGGEVYALAMTRATHLLLTWIDTETPDADTFFPEFDPRDWRETARVHHPADARHAFAFDFVDYERASTTRHPGESRDPVPSA